MQAVQFQQMYCTMCLVDFTMLICVDCIMSINVDAYTMWMSIVVKCTMEICADCTMYIHLAIYDANICILYTINTCGCVKQIPTSSFRSRIGSASHLP